MIPPGAVPEAEFRDHLQVLRRRKWVVLGSVVIVVAAALIVSYTQTPRYASVAKMLLRPQSTQSVFGTNMQPNVDPAREIDTEIEVIKTEPVKDLVRSKIGSSPPIQVSSVGQTDLVTIRAESTVAQRAAVIANAYANAYVEFRRKQALDDLFAGSEGIQTKLTDLQKQIDELGATIAAAPLCVDTKTTAADCNTRANIEQTVGQRRTTLQNQQALFRQRLDQLQVDATLASGRAQLVTPASVSGAPFAPTPIRSGALGVVVGLLLGIGSAFVIEYLDDSLKSKDDFERALPGLSVLGLIPLVEDWKSAAQSRVVSISEPTSSAAEAYRILRTSIQFLGLDKQVRIIQVTSPSAQEGKTTTLANLAVAFAASGLRTVAIDCDLRRPRLHEFLGLPNAFGFTSVLLGSVPLSKALQQVPGQERLLVLASGPLPPNPSELLSSARVGELFSKLGCEADVVLIDSPPALPVTDALILSQLVDSVVLVTTAGTTTKKAAVRAAEMLQQISAPIVGGVLNGVRQDGGYGSYSYRYYSANTEPGGELASVAAEAEPQTGRRRRSAHPV